MSNVHIDNLNLRLPASLADRAESIARQLGEQLSQLSWSGSQSVSSIDVPTLVLHGGESDQVIAQHIARSLQHQLSEQAGGRPSGGIHAAD